MLTAATRLLGPLLCLLAILPAAERAPDEPADDTEAPLRLERAVGQTVATGRDDPAGSSGMLLVGRTDEGHDCASLLAFDLDALPAWRAQRERHVVAATLVLHPVGVKTRDGSGPARIEVAMLRERDRWRPGRVSAHSVDGGRNWSGRFPDEVRALPLDQAVAEADAPVRFDVTTALLEWMQELGPNAGFLIRVATPPRSAIERVEPDQTRLDGLVGFAGTDDDVRRPRLEITFANGPPRFRPPVEAQARTTGPYRLGYARARWVVQRPHLFAHLTHTTAGGDAASVRRLNHYGIQVLRWVAGPSQGGDTAEWYTERYAPRRDDTVYAGISADEWGGPHQRMVASAQALRRYRADHPDRFVAVWEINRGPELQDLLRDGTVDVVLIEGYVHYTNHREWRADFNETMRRARLWREAGLIDKVVIGWGHMTGEIDDTGGAMAPGQLEWNMREAKRRFPEMAGTAFFYATEGGWTPMNEALLETARDLSFELYPRPEDPPLPTTTPPAGDRRGSGIRWEQWTDLREGTAPGDIPVDRRPRRTEVMPRFQAPADAGDRFGSRMHGWLRPPVDGDYVFAIASDDRSELWLSTDRHPKNRRRIAFHTGWVDVCEFHVEAGTQRSQPITLEGGRVYYIEARHSDDRHSDHLAVAWEGPGFRQQIIEGVYLAPAPER